MRILDRQRYWSFLKAYFVCFVALVGLSGRAQSKPVPVEDQLFESARARMQNKQIIGLASTGDERSVLLPNVPTFGEQGFAGFDVDSWIGMYAPARLPADIQAAWVTALRAKSGFSIWSMAVLVCVKGG